MSERPDPLDRLADFDAGEPVTPSPAEIRRRGDRRRRRTTGLIAAVAAVAVAAVAIPVGVLAAGPDARLGEPVATPSASPTPAVTSTPTPTGTPTRTSAPSSPAPTTSAPTTAAERQIPDDFPLQANYPEADGESELRPVTRGTAGVEPFVHCGKVVWIPTRPRPTDLVHTGYTGPEDFRSRILALYPTDAQAAQTVETTRGALNACPVDGDQDSESVFEEVVLRVEPGLVVSVFTQRYRTGGSFTPGLTVHQLVRVENAVYRASYYGEVLGSDPKAVDEFVADAEDQSAEIVTAMRKSFGR